MPSYSLDHQECLRQAFSPRGLFLQDPLELPWATNLRGINCISFSGDPVCETAGGGEKRLGNLFFRVNIGPGWETQ